MENTPISCRTSSAAIVSGRILESAKATSSGILLSKWWQTINISKCSSKVLTVYGIVGFVDAGKIFGKPATLMMSGAWPPPAPSVWNVCIVLPAIASIVSSTQPASFNVSVWTATWTSYLSAAVKQESITAGVEPQSSWIFRPAAPAKICSSKEPWAEQLPLP